MKQLNEKGSVKFEAVQIRKNGDSIHVEVNTKVKTIGGDDFIVSVCREITDRKKAESDLEKSHALLDATGRMARVGGWELDAETLELTWTDETCRIHEIPLDQKPPLQEAIHFFHPEDRPKLEQAIQRALDHAKPYDMEIRFITAKGNHLWTRTICRPVTVDGKVVKLSGTFQDVTQRKKAEEKYTESALKLRQAVEAGNVGLWDWDLVTNRVYYSAEWKRQIGFADDEITNDFEEWRSRVHPDDLEKTLEKVQKSIDSASRNHVVEFRFKHRDGSYRWIMAHSSIMVDDKGHPVRMLGSHIDITEQKKSEELIRQSETKLRSILNSSPFPVAIVDLQDDNILFWSRSALDIFGHTAPTTSEWFQIAYPDPDYRKDVIERWKPFLEEARKSREPVNTGEYRICCKDGSIRICELHVTFLSDSLVVTFNDITERQEALNAVKKNEVRFRTLFENMYDGAAIYRAENDGDDFVFQDINKSGETLSRVRKAEIINQRITDVFPGVRDMGLFDVLQRVYMTGKTEKLPITQYRDDRISEWVDNTVFRLPSNEVVAVYRDETQRHAAEDEVRKINRELEKRVAERTKKLRESNEELEDFVYSVSHDLRAPLRSISGFSEIIHRRHKASLNEEGQHYFDNIVKASAQMGHLIDDLLTFSRLGRKAVKSEKVPLDDVVKTAVETLSRQIEESGAQINVSKKMPVVRGDITLARHVFINLLENAVKYRRPDINPVVTVTHKVCEQHAVISIADNGIGIEPEYREKIFKIFQRLHSQTDYPGTGIGLAAVKKALQIMGGRITVESEPGKGSVFIIEMPVDR
jgi:PAS domain S-box-containing protein